MSRPLSLPLIGAVAAAAAAAPSLLAFNLPPSPTFLNQAVAIALWGWFVSTLARSPDHTLLPALVRATWSPLLGMVLVALAALGSWLLGGLPHSLALSGAGALLAAAALLLAGAAARRHPQAAGILAAFCGAWLLAGTLNAAVACIQVFAPGWADGDWIARSGVPGRAVGNLRQPNHLSTLLIWSTVALVPALEARRLRTGWAVAWAAFLILAVVLTASRTGVLSVVVLAVWGLVDKRLRTPTRALLLATPVLYALAWWAVATWAATSGHLFGGEARLGESDLSASRFGIWANTWALITAHPWWGVGFGEFNFAWSLSVFPGRPVAFFDHAHNLPLHLAAELGLPLAGLVCGLFLWGLWQGWQHLQRSRASDSPLYPALASVGVMVLLVGLHSQLEYPLWYAYFLLPTAWAWGFVLGGPAPAAQPAARPQPTPTQAPALPSRLGNGLQWAGVLLVLGAGLAFLDYVRVAQVFVAGDATRTLDERIASGQRSVLFAHHADYAAATLEPPTAGADIAFAGATHYLLDTRLMVAWARHLHTRGHTEAAQHLAARLREFRNPGSRELFAACTAASSPPPAFPCAPPPQAVPWREFQGIR